MPALIAPYCKFYVILRRICVFDGLLCSKRGQEAVGRRFKRPQKRRVRGVYHVLQMLGR